MAFGLPPLTPNEPIAFALGAIDHRDAGVREAALALLVTLLRPLGSMLLSSPLLKDASESTRKALAAEAAKL